MNNTSFVVASIIPYIRIAARHSREGQSPRFQFSSLIFDHQAWKVCCEALVKKTISSLPFDDSSIVDKKAKGLIEKDVEDRLRRGDLSLFGNQEIAVSTEKKDIDKSKMIIF